MGYESSGQGCDSEGVASAPGAPGVKSSAPAPTVGVVEPSREQEQFECFLERGDPPGWARLPVGTGYEPQ